MPTTPRSCTRLKPGAWTLFQVSYNEWLGLKYLSHHLSFPRVYSSKTKIRSRAGTQTKHSDMGYGCLKQLLKKIVHVFIWKAESWWDVCVERSEDLLFAGLFPQMATRARGGLSWSQEPETPSESIVRAVGAQVLGSYISLTSQAHYHGGWIGSGITRIWTVALFAGCQHHKPQLNVLPRRPTPRQHLNWAKRPPLACPIFNIVALPRDRSGMSALQSDGFEIGS